MSEILFLAHRLPWPPDRGDRIRSHHLLRALAEIATVHLGCFIDEERERAGLAAVAPLLASAHVEAVPRGRMAAAARGLARGEPLSVALYASETMRRWVESALAHHSIDCVFAFSSQMAQFVPVNTQRFVMDFVDVDSAKFEAYAATSSWPMSAIYAREAAKLAKYETNIARRATRSLLVSNTEAASFKARTGIVAEAIGNGVDLERFDPLRVTPEAAEGPLLVFTGQMDYPPNIEAVASFARETLPRIRRAFPDTRFAVVGRAPSAAVRALASAAVIVTGEVDDGRPWLAAADVVVAPLALGRGVQNKVLEAMAMARPVIVSPAAHAGIDAVDGVHLLVADSAAAQAQSVIDLLRKPERAAALGEAARARMIERYSWRAQLAGLDAIVGISPTVCVERSRDALAIAA